MINAQDYCLAQCKRYWPKGATSLSGLSIAQSPSDCLGETIPALVMVTMPPWALDLAPQGQMLIPEGLLVAGGGDPWERVDWWQSLAWFLRGGLEAAFERMHGPIHSYSYRLHNFPPELWQFAWANRMALFLRRYASRRAARDETEMFGPLPPARLIMTHDVDAIDKTVAITIKQSSFLFYQTIRELLHLRFAYAWTNAQRLFSFLTLRCNYREALMSLCEMETQLSIAAIYHFAALNLKQRSWVSRLLDPSYDLLDSSVQELLREITGRGHTIGLHPSFESWNDELTMTQQRCKLAAITRQQILVSRQHWLRFSWHSTWQCLVKAGITFDSTLGFNDRPGFRVGAALRYQPWIPGSDDSLKIDIVPLILMDSHIFDYSSLKPEQQESTIQSIIDELVFVHGEAAILWHPHTLSEDYGWSPSFLAVLKYVVSMREQGKIEVATSQ